MCAHLNPQVFTVEHLHGWLNFIPTSQAPASRHGQILTVWNPEHHWGRFFSLDCDIRKRDPCEQNITKRVLQTSPVLLESPFRLVYSCKIPSLYLYEFYACYTFIRKSGNHQNIIWVNYNISLTWIKAIWGWFPLLTMIPVRSQWGRYNLPRYHQLVLF